MGIQDLEKKKVRSTTRFSARAQLGSLAEFERRKSEVIRQNDRRRTRAA